MENTNYHSKDKDELLLKEIADQNLIAQNQYLVDNGFCKLKRNLKFLLNFEKNQENALAALKEKNTSWKNKDENCLKKLQERIEKMNFQDQNAFLVSKGFQKIRKNFKKLEKFNGDKDKALESLIKQREKCMNMKKRFKEAKDKIFSEEIIKLGYSLQNETLMSKGFTNPRLNLKVLTKSKGDILKALELIQKKCEIRELKSKLRGDVSPDSMKKRHERENKKNLREEFKTWLLKEVKPNTKIVYLDGNNMFFVNSFIRKLCLNHKTKEAEILIGELAIEFGKIFGIDQLVLLFDTTNNLSRTTIGSLKFSVCSASPNFKTSDDALVDWMDGSAHDDILIVTSDLGLQIRLKEKGVKMIMKTGCWFKILKDKLGEEIFSKIISKD